MSIRSRILACLGLLFPLSAALAQTPTPTPAPTTVSTVTSWTTENNRAVSGVNVKPQPDGSVWFLVPSNDRIVQLQPDGITFKQWQIRADKDIGANPVDFEIDGKYVWIVENGESLIDAGFSAIARLDTTSGALREWVIFGSRPTSLYRAPDGKFWVPQSNGVIESLDPASLQVVNYVSRGVFAYSDAVIGPDGALWLIDFGNNRIVRWELGAATETGWTLFDPAAGRLNLSQLTFDSAGKLWVSELSGNRIDRFDPATNTLTAWGGFQNPIHFDLFGNKVYVSEAQQAPGIVAVLDPVIAFGSDVTLTPVTNIMGSTSNPRVGQVRDSTAIVSTFTSTKATVAASDVVVALATVGILATRFPSTNAYGIAATPGGVWVGSEGLLLFVALQTIGTVADPAVPVAAEFGVAPGDHIEVETTFYNKGGSPMAVDALYMYSPGSFAARRTVNLDPGQTLVLPETFSDAASLRYATFGPVRFQVTSGNAGDLLASVRSARIREDGSSFGFSMPALAAADALGSGSTKTLFTGARDSDVSVFGFYSSNGADATVALVAPDGTVRGTRRLQVTANGAQEFNPAASVVGAAPEPGDTIRVTVASGSLLPYVNVLDTGSGDVATSLPAAQTTGSFLSNVSNAAAGDVTFVSDLYLANGDPANPANVTLTFFAAGPAPSAPRLATVAIPPGGSLVVPDALTMLFSTTGEGAISVTSDAAVAASARVGSRRPEGDYGTFEVAVAGGPAGSLSDQPRDSVGAPQNDARQTDLLLFNGGSGSVVVTVTGYDEGGTAFGSADVPLATGQAVRVPAVITTLGGGPTSSARVRVVLGAPSGGSVTALMEQVDLTTGDVDFAPLR
jgi:streptogramin lyase